MACSQIESREPIKTPTINIGGSLLCGYISSFSIWITRELPIYSCVCFRAGSFSYFNLLPLPPGTNTKKMDRLRAPEVQQKPPSAPKEERRSWRRCARTRSRYFRAFHSPGSVPISPNQCEPLRIDSSERLLDLGHGSACW